MALIQTKSGRHVRAYFNGTNVGLARMKSIKPDISTPLDPVMELGNPNVAEFVPKVSQTTLTFDYMVISYGQLAVALGLTYGSSSSNPNAINGVVGEVPRIPSTYDIVERLIKPGTEKTSTEVYYGYTIYQKILIEKETWDEEADKVISVNISAKCIPPRRYEGINGIKFDAFTGNGSTTAFVLTSRAVPGADGYNTIRADVGGGNTSLNEGFDYTSASTSSNTTVTFNNAPPTGGITIIYAY